MQHMGHSPNIPSSLWQPAVKQYPELKEVNFKALCLITIYWVSLWFCLCSCWSTCTLVLCWRWGAQAAHSTSHIYIAYYYYFVLSVWPKLQQQSSWEGQRAIVPSRSSTHGTGKAPFSRGWWQQSSFICLCLLQHTAVSWGLSFCASQPSLSPLLFAKSHQGSQETPSCLGGGKLVVFAAFTALDLLVEIKSDCGIFLTMEKSFLKAPELTALNWWEKNNWHCFSIFHPVRSNSLL